jgi:signal transduction histidine kinase
MDQVGEMLVFGVAGVIVGLFVDRERGQRIKLERTKSELEQVYTELRENLDRLRKAERMFTVAQLSASLAHEIRNPLASISGAAGILKRGHGNPQNIRECVEIIDKESQRLSKLLTNFLDFARPRAPRFQRTDLGAVIDSVIALADHSPGAAAIQFKKEIQPDLPEVECDSEQLKQVLLNLVINAIQATGNGEVRLCAHARNGTATVSVQDQGHGIPADQQDQIFEPFFTTKEHGTGLGLAIAAKIVEQHGGLLKAESTPGRGLTMMLELPLERKQAV